MPTIAAKKLRAKVGWLMAWSEDRHPLGTVLNSPDRDDVIFHDNTDSTINIFYSVHVCDCHM